MKRALHSREINKERPTIRLGTNLLTPFFFLVHFTCHCWCETKDLSCTMVWRTNTINWCTHIFLFTGWDEDGRTVPQALRILRLCLVSPTLPIKPIVGVEGKKLSPEPSARGEGGDFVTFTTGGTEAQEARVLRLGELFPETVSQSEAWPEEAMSLGEQTGCSGSTPVCPYLGHCFFYTLILLSKS